MKRHEPLLLLCVLAISTQGYASNNNDNDHDHDSCDFEATSKSYINFQQPFQPMTPEYVAGFRSMNHAAEDGIGGAIQLAFFGGKTTKNSHLARYFAPFGINAAKTPIRFGADIGGVQQFDILAQHFGVFTVNETNPETGTNPDTSDQFLSEVKLKPKQTMFGGGVQWRQSFWRNEEKGRGWWISFSFPIVHVKNHMHFRENVVNAGGGAIPQDQLPEGVVAFANLTEAFEQEGWNFGKIKTHGSLKKTRVADIDLRFGYEWLQYEPYHLESFVGLVIPTGNRPKAHHLFEAIVGNGGHFGLEWGAVYSMTIWECEEREAMITMEHSAVNKYLFKREQVRSLDLKYKPWSRYIQLYRTQEDAQAAATAEDAFSFTPGINVLTREVDVTPGYQFQLNSAFIFDWRGFELEGGFNLLARRAECVELANNWNETAAIKALQGQGFTNPVRDMTGNPFLELTVINPDIPPTPTLQFPVPVANYAQSIIKESDLDLNSAATPATLAYTIYGNLAYVFDIVGWPFLVDAGGSYTFAHENSVIDRWTVWGKFGFAF